MSRHVEKISRKVLHSTLFFTSYHLSGGRGLIYFLFKIHFPFFSPSLTHPCTIQHPPYIHHRPDYANMGPFMSSELRIFSCLRVCKEAHYHHWPFVENSLQSAASLLTAALTAHHCLSTKNGSGLRKAAGRLTGPTTG